MANSPSFDQLVGEHLPDMLRFATRLTGGLGQAEEIVQEALLRAVRGWPAYRGQAGFRTWVWRIVINVFRDQLKARRLPLEPGADIDHIEQREAGPQEAALMGELERRVASEVSRLPPRQREVLVLMVYEGMSAADVAQALGVREGNVHSTLSIARAQLRARLSHYLNSLET